MHIFDFDCIGDLQSPFHSAAKAAGTFHQRIFANEGKKFYKMKLRNQINRCTFERSKTMIKTVVKVEGKTLTLTHTSTPSISTSNICFAALAIFVPGPKMPATPCW